MNVKKRLDASIVIAAASVFTPTAHLSKRRGDRWRDKRNHFITQQTAEQMFAFCLSFWTFSRSWAKTLCSMFTFAWVNFGNLVSSNPLWPLFTYPFAQTFNGVSVKCEQMFSKSWFLWFDKKDTWQEWGRTELALSWVESARVALFLCLQVGEHPPTFPYCFRLGFFFQFQLPRWIQACKSQKDVAG